MAAVHYHEGRFPPEERLDWPALIPLIGPAVAAVTRYDGALAAIPNPRVLLSPMTTQEAVLSSRIEDTQATMGEVLEFEAGKELAGRSGRMRTSVARRRISGQDGHMPSVTRPSAASRRVPDTPLPPP